MEQEPRELLFAARASGQPADPGAVRHIRRARRGGFTPRHLLDIAVLARGLEPVDWDRLRALASTRLAAHALGAQLAAAARLSRARVPRHMIGPWARLQHARHMAQYRWPRLSTALAGLGLAADGLRVIQHRAADRAAQRRILGAPTAPLSMAGRLERTRYILRGLADGKI